MGPPGPHGMSHERGTVRNPCLHLHKAFASVLMWGVGVGLQFQVVEGKDYFNLAHSRTNQILGRETVVCHLYPSHPEMLHSLESVRAEEVVEHGQMDRQTDGQIDRQIGRLGERQTYPSGNLPVSLRKYLSVHCYKDHYEDGVTFIYVFNCCDP